MKYQVDANGFYGQFGGSFVPPVLKSNLDELQAVYLQEITKPDFQEEWRTLLRDYVGRPSPLYHSRFLSQIAGAKVYLKREDLNHTGAHKINNTIGQALLAKRLGKKRVIAETGAGQHGVATATVCALLQMPCTVYMGALDMERQAVNVERMRMLGAEVVGVHEGTKTLTEAVDAALVAWCANPVDTFYLLGSAVGPHPYPAMVTAFQSIISEEIKKQLLEKEGRDYPDFLVACVGGGSNAIGTFYHFLEEERTQLIIAEAAGRGLSSGQTAATLELGKAKVLHGANTLVLQDEQGEVVEPYSISAGLDYPGVGPLLAHLATTGRAQYMGIEDQQALDAAYGLTRSEGIIPAIESAHALAVLTRYEFPKDAVVVVTLSGRGDKDLHTYLNNTPSPL